MAVRCWLFGHDWLHLDTYFVDGSRLASAHHCDRCGDERTVIIEVEELTDLDDTTPSSMEVDA